jgi:predicted site-specific integrase-resolvase
VYDEDSVYAFIGLKKKRNNKKVISYSRVSTQNQKSQLKDQTQRIYNSCISKGLSLDEQIEDIKSGMSFDRKCFRHLCEEVIRGNVELIVIENKDRLMRFGFEIFEGLFKYFGTKILVLSDEVSNKTYEQELSDDLIAIIHYFSMKSYSHRRKLNKIRKELE